MADENQIDQGPAVPPQAEEQAGRGVRHARQAAGELGSAGGAAAGRDRRRAESEASTRSIGRRAGRAEPQRRCGAAGEMGRSWAAAAEQTLAVGIVRGGAGTVRTAAGTRAETGAYLSPRPG